MSAEELRERQQMLLRKFRDPNTTEVQAEKFLQELDDVEKELK